MARQHLQLDERFDQPCLRVIVNINWSIIITIIEVLEKVKVCSIEAMLLKSQARESHYAENIPQVIVTGGAGGVMVIVIGHGHSDMSSNPGRDWLHFT